MGMRVASIISRLKLYAPADLRNQWLLFEQAAPELVLRC